MARNEKQGIQSVEQGMELLKVMAANGQPMMLRDLAAAVGMNPSSAHRYLTSFIRSGFVEQDPASGLYELGPYALSFSLAALRRLDHVRLAAPELSALCTSLGHTVLLAVWGNLGPTVVRWEEAAEPLTVNVRIGSVFPVLRSATGRVFAAYLPWQRVQPLIAREISDKSGKGQGDWGQVEALLAKVRAEGLARIEGDLVPGVHAVAAPVFDYRGEIIAVMTTLGYGSVFDASLDGAPARAIRAAAARLSARLGWEGSSAAIAHGTLA